MKAFELAEDKKAQDCAKKLFKRALAYEERKAGEILNNLNSLAIDCVKSEYFIYHGCLQDLQFAKDNQNLTDVLLSELNEKTGKKHRLVQIQLCALDCSIAPHNDQDYCKEMGATKVLMFAVKIKSRSKGFDASEPHLWSNGKFYQVRQHRSICFDPRKEHALLNSGHLHLLCLWIA